MKRISVDLRDETKRNEMKQTTKIIKKQWKKPKITGKNPHRARTVYTHTYLEFELIGRKRVRAHSAMIDPKTKSEWPHFFVVIQHSGLSFLLLLLVAPYNLCHRRCRICRLQLLFTTFFGLFHWISSSFILSWQCPIATIISLSLFISVLV